MHDHLAAKSSPGPVQSGPVQEMAKPIPSLYRSPRRTTALITALLHGPLPSRNRKAWSRTKRHDGPAKCSTLVWRCGACPCLGPPCWAWPCSGPPCCNRNPDHSPHSILSRAYSNRAPQTIEQHRTYRWSRDMQYLGVAVLGTAVLGTAMLGTAVLGTAVLGTAVLHPRARSLRTQHSPARIFQHSIFITESHRT